MRFAIETSSLFPLFVFTSYSVPLYQHLNEIRKGENEIVVHQDSIDEAQQISILTKSEDIIGFMQKFHNNNKLSFLRSILEYFPGNMYGNNSSRAVALFVLDVLDSIPPNLNYESFKVTLKERLQKKIRIILKGLTPINNKIIANPQLIQSYWHPRIDISNIEPFEIIVRENGMPLKSTRNRDRDIFHYELVLFDNDIDTILVCDQGYKKQIPESVLKVPIKTIKSLNLAKLERIG